MTKVFVLLNGDNDVVGVYWYPETLFRAWVADMLKHPNWLECAVAWIAGQDSFNEKRKAAMTKALRGEKYSMADVLPHALFELFDYTVERHVIQ
jgi:hypothetical protein